MPNAPGTSAAGNVSGTFLFGGFLNCSWSGLWSRTNLPHETIQEARGTTSSWDEPGMQRPHHNKLFLRGGETCHYKNVIKVCTHIWQLV